MSTLKIFRCDTPPCPAWSLDNKKCYRCDKRCAELRQHRRPAARDLLTTLGCDADCEAVVVTSSGGAGVWQNKRTGLFTFVGEHNGRPLYKKNATAEYLYYLQGSEWLIGPDFNKAHGGECLVCFQTVLFNFLFVRNPVV